MRIKLMIIGIKINKGAVCVAFLEACGGIVQINK